MPLTIQRAHVSSPEAARKLVLDSLGIEAGISEILDPDLPIAGHPLLALDNRKRPVVVSFDPDDGARALIAGLAAWEEIVANAEWLARQFPALTAEIIARELRLLTLSPAPLPGARLVMRGHPFISFCYFRILRISGETGVLFERPAPAGEEPAPGGRIQPTYEAAEPGLNGLTEEEEAYFEKMK